MHGQGSFRDARLGISITKLPDLVASLLPALRQYQFSLSSPTPAAGRFDAGIRSLIAMNHASMFPGQLFPTSPLRNHPMTSMSRCLIAMLLTAVSPYVTRAQSAPGTSWDTVGSILQAPGTLTGGYHRYNLPRRDITLRMGDVTVSPSLALGAWAGFSGTSTGAMIMGDLVLTNAELKPVLAEFARQRLDVTAIHNHLSGEEPRITYVHFHGQGRATELATRLDHALALTSTPRPVAASSSPPVSIDTAMVFRVLGASGKAQGNVAQLSFILVPGRVTMHGRTVVPALGYGSPVNVQMVDSARIVATGDFAVLGAKVPGVVDALATNGITATAVHSHLIGEQPTLYYIHFWADGRPANVLAGLRAAIDAAR